MEKQNNYGGALCGLGLGMLLFAWLFRQGKSREALLLLLLGFVCAAALSYLPLQRRKEKEEKRKAALNRDYSQLLTLLCLYMTAGLSLRSSWERLVRQYEASRSKGGPLQPVYEEMLRSWKQIRGGVYEDRAYGDFGRQCGTPEYLRLGGLLETYVQQGNREILKQLEQEAISSMSLSLQKAKEKGEQTGTRLLFPLLLLFGLSLLMIIVPAVMSMQAGIS